MLISHKHRFIFFAVPKTATHAIRRGLEGCLAPGDWQQQQLFGKDVLPIAALARIGHGHITVQELRRHMPSEQYQSYLKFAFVRNPYDRFVSVCAFLNRNNPEFVRNATDWMKRALERPRFRQRVLVRTQCEMLTDEEGRLGLDVIGRYETLQSSFSQICQSIGISAQMLEVSNASAHSSYRSYYDIGLQQAVSEFYADDFEQFQYTTELDIE